MLASTNSRDLGAAWSERIDGVEVRRLRASTDYLGRGFPHCYDNHTGSDFILQGGFSAMDDGTTVVAAADGSLRAHMQYVLVGAGSVIFAIAPEVRRLTGLDPTKPQAIETHADIVARLLVP